MRIGFPRIALDWIGGGGAAPFVGPLDAQTTGLAFARSIEERLLSSYPGTSPLFRLRHGVTNVETDWAPLANGAVPVASIEAAYAGVSAYFVKVYDQFGLGHLVQPTAAAQPRAVNAGVWLGKVEHDGVDDFMVSAVTIGAGISTRSVFMKALLRNVLTLQMIYELSPVIGTYIGHNYYYNVGDLRTLLNLADTGGNSAISRYDGNMTSGIVNCIQSSISASLSGQGIGVSAYHELWRAGVARNEDLNITTGTPAAAGAFSNTNEYIGMRGGVSLPASLDWQCCVSYNSGLTGDLGARIAAISAALA